MAQSARAILLASAAATSIFGFRASMRESHDPLAIDVRPNRLRRDIAPMISSLRMSVWPAFDIRPSRSLPPDECCRGTRPSHAAKSRPRLNVPIGGAKASIASAMSGPTPGIVCSRRAVPVCAARSFAFFVCLDPGRFLGDLLHQVPAFLTDQRGQIADRLIEDRLDALELPDPLRNDVAVLVKHPPQGVHQFGALMDKTLPGTEQYGASLLVFGLGFDEAHLGALRRDYDRLGVGRIVLLTFHERSHILRRDQLTSCPSLQISRFQ